jgi:hypothetical protein
MELRADSRMKALSITIFNFHGRNRIWFEETAPQRYWCSLTSRVLSSSISFPMLTEANKRGFSLQLSAG